MKLEGYTGSSNTGDDIVIADMIFQCQTSLSKAANKTKYMFSSIFIVFVVIGNSVVIKTIKL